MYETGTLTRTFKFLVDPSKSTATVTSCINGRDLDYITGKDHTADHCASVDYYSSTSVSIGWGLHIPVDMGLPAAANFGWKQGAHPIFTDYNPTTDSVSLELCVLPSDARLAANHGSAMCGAYRTCKTAHNNG